MKHFTPFFLGAGLLISGASALSAATLDIPSDGSVYIRASQSNQVGNTSMLVGQTTTADDILRGVFSFDLSDPALTGATINSVTLTFEVYKKDFSSTSGLTTLEVYELTTAFSENTATWTTPWTTPGGDYSPTLLASTQADPRAVDEGDFVAFSDAALTSNIASSIGGSVDLISKLAIEDNAERQIFFFLRTSPVLSIDYTAVPEPSTYALFAGALVLACVAYRRTAKSRQ